MTRLWILSDLHMTADEMWQREPMFPPPDADVCVVAGDILDGQPEAAMKWLGYKIRPFMPVVCVLGNHDFYDESIEGAREDAAEFALEYGIDFLDDTAVEIDGVRFVGSTLWTDFWLYAGDDPDLRRRHMSDVGLGLTDHYEITRREDSSELFTPSDAADLHNFSRDFLNRTLAEPFDGPTVVVTHHAPHPLSIAREYKGDPLTPGFVSDMSDLIERHQPDLWIHGHTHHVFDYQVGDTRIICNPRGHTLAPTWHFKRDLVIDVDDLVPRPPGP